MEISSDVASKILERLRESEEKDGQLPDFMQFYRELLKIQGKALCGASVIKPDLAADVAYDRLCEGIPLLSFGDFQPDWLLVQKTFEQVATWLARDSRDTAGEVETLMNISRNPSLLKEIMRVWYQQFSVAGIQGVGGIEHDLLTSVIAAALKPFLFAYSRCLLPEVKQELWRRQYCPTCGGKPDFSYLDREKGARWLLCSRCDAEWLFLRTVCPYCGTRNEDALFYFTDEEDYNIYRLYVCEECGTYIKTIDLRRTELDVLLPLERFTTLDMDRQAQEKGYRPGWSSLVPAKVSS